MQLPPLSAYTSWPKANYIDPTTIAPFNQVTTLVLLPVVWIVVVARLYTRVILSRSFGWDDGLIIAALIVTTIFGTLNVVLVKNLGWNRHTWDVQVSDVITGLKYVLAMEVTFSLSALLCKLSMLGLLYRIFGGAGRLRHVILAAFIVMGSVGVIITFLLLFQCHPIHYYWALSFTPQKQCWNDLPLLLVSGIINSVADMVVVLIPLPSVLKLQLPRREKFIVGILFGVGCTIVLVGALRTYYQGTYRNTPDRVWFLQKAWMLASLELYVGIICACVPPLKKFVTCGLPSFLNPLHKEFFRTNTYIPQTPRQQYQRTTTDLSTGTVDIEMDTGNSTTSDLKSELPVFGSEDLYPRRTALLIETTTTLAQYSEAGSTMTGVRRSNGSSVGGGTGFGFVEEDVCDTARLSASYMGNPPSYNAKVVGEVKALHPT